LEKKREPGDPVDCRAASRLLSAAYERKLSPMESQALTYHLDRCFMCRNFDSQLKFLHAASERFRSGDE
jgi:predicted anti-sigma-YlaC factor YlaD